MIRKYCKRPFLLPLVGSLVVLLTGCGARPAPSANEASWPTVSVQLDDITPLMTLPLTLALRLGTFHERHVKIVFTNKSHTANVTLSSSPQRPVVGYLATRPDLVLVSPRPDPHFRLRALNHLPIFYSPIVHSEIPLVSALLKTQRAHITQWTPIPFSQMKQLWRRQHLPWAVVTLSEAQVLKHLDARTVTLSWLGASTGPIPTVMLEEHRAEPAVTRFLAGLNLALWYLHTTPPAAVASILSNGHQDSQLVQEIRQALHYQYWPNTTYPDSSTYARMTSLMPQWQSYTVMVDPGPALQALSEMDK